MAPLFDFRCLTCSHTFDALVSRDALPPCPKCGGEAKKLLSRFEFVLKGSGWAKDNYGLKEKK